nr:GNAT family N-acetyltransferase [Streptomyces antimycoticus]
MPVAEPLEDAGSVVGLCELAVRPPWQSQGIGSHLRADLLKTIAPKWSSLLALPSDRRGQDLYARLGYEYAGPYRNTADGPEFDLLLLQVEETAWPLQYPMFTGGASLQAGRPLPVQLLLEPVSARWSGTPSSSRRRNAAWPPLSACASGRTPP